VISDNRQKPIRVLILGAAGRDFHNFNTVFRDDPRYEVVAFTAAQIPDIAGRTYPPELAGRRYPKGIPIYPQKDFVRLIGDLSVDQVVFAYSDVSHGYVMDLGSAALAAGCDYRFIGPRDSMIRSNRPVVAVTAVRTGAGKSQTTRALVDLLREHGKRLAVIRHPMPYGDLLSMAVQRFATLADLDAAGATIEELEEYEPHIDAGSVVYAGVDYGRILEMAEKECDIVVWDGGNNDLSFYRPDLNIVVLDPLRAGDERTYFPGQVNLRMADVAVINKIDSATPEQLAIVEASLAELNPGATVLRAESTITVTDPELIRGKRVVVVEDGPTLTHGGMSYGAGLVAAKRYGAAEIVDPHPYAVRSIAATYAQYPTTGPVLPAMGYGAAQVRDLEETLRATPADAVVIGTPIDLGRIIHVDRPTLRVRYELKVVGSPTLRDVVEDFLRRR
jgi:predicted GTPase